MYFSQNKWHCQLLYFSGSIEGTSFNSENTVLTCKADKYFRIFNIRTAQHINYTCSDVEHILTLLCKEIFVSFDALQYEIYKFFHHTKITRYTVVTDCHTHLTLRQEAHSTLTELERIIWRATHSSVSCVAWALHLKKNSCIGEEKQSVIYRYLLPYSGSFRVVQIFAFLRRQSSQREF